VTASIQFFRECLFEKKNYDKVFRKNGKKLRKMAIFTQISAISADIFIS
jgi:hypothetical protein